MTTNTLKGLAWSLASAFLWSTTFVCARYLLADARTDPLTLSTARFLLGGLALLGIGALRPGMLQLRLRPADLARLAGLALCGLAGMSVLLFYGQKHTTAINSSMLMQLSPVFILILGIGIGERITRRNLAALLLSLCGTMLVVGIITPAGVSAPLAAARGDLLVLGGAFCWALYAILSKPTVQRLGGFTATTWVMLAGAAELLVLRLALPAEFIPPAGADAWAIIIYMALFPTALAFFAWYEAMRLIDLAVLNVMQYLTPVFTIVLAGWWLGERLTWMQGLGIAVVLSGIALLRPAAQKRLAKPPG